MVLTLDKLCKRYGNKIVLNDIDISFENGIYGLLGPNGAGKSTLIRIIVGLLEASSGKVLCDGQSKENLKSKYYDYIGYMPQYSGFYDNFTGYQMMDYYAALKGLKKKEREKKINELLELVNMSNHKRKKVGHYSGGMKQRLGVAIALLNDPNILILDEPTAGLDPKERIRFRNLISKISDNRITIIATHIVSDIESIANKIILLSQGNVVRNGTVDELCKEIDGCVSQIVTDDNMQAEECIKNYNVSNIYRNEGKYYIRIVSKQKIEIQCDIMSPKLDDVYLYYFNEIGEANDKI